MVVDENGLPEHYRRKQNPKINILIAQDMAHIQDRNMVITVVHGDCHIFCPEYRLIPL